ncbi:hypothetical protein ACH46_03020 [Gordonia phthalatica]|uniref:NIPSNAP domain-containing protein n=1 Tax=Gordonia phthalatica TaxID=1136941 RepID=A0A0N9NDM9_9ACTN|nr:hypothetical protein ACH46_03020 [Gordonia phthalatica]
MRKDHDLSEAVYIVDRVVTAPGAGREFVRRYRNEYVPAAARRGLVLDSVLVSPPLWLDHDVNTVTAVLAVADVDAWWAAALAARHDPDPSAWWSEVAPLIESRSRTSAARDLNLAALADV